MAEEKAPIFAQEELEQNHAHELELIRLICSGNAVLFVGAGCSAFSEYPTWRILIAELKMLAQ